MKGFLVLTVAMASGYNHKASRMIIPSSIKLNQTHQLWKKTEVKQIHVTNLIGYLKQNVLEK